MPSVYRITVLWSGFQGAPGYSKFSFSDLTNDTARNNAGASIRQFFVDQYLYLPPAVTIAVQPAIQEYDAATSTLIGEASMTIVPPTLAGGAPAGNWAGGSGYVTTWRSNAIYSGRRVLGRTFMVPATNCFESDGTLQGPAVTIMNTAATTLINTAGSDLAIWAKAWTKTTPPVQTGGSVFSVTSGAVKDQASQLRSRRQ